MKHKTAKPTVSIKSIHSIIFLHAIIYCLLLASVVLAEDLIFMRRNKLFVDRLEINSSNHQIIINQFVVNP